MVRKIDGPPPSYLLVGNTEFSVVSMGLPFLNDLTPEETVAAEALRKSLLLSKLLTAAVPDHELTIAVAHPDEIRVARLAVNAFLEYGPAPAFTPIGVSMQQEFIQLYPENA